MSDIKTTRLSKAARELNVGINTIVEFLHKKGVKIDSNPNEKIAPEHYDLLLKEFSTDIFAKKESEKLILKAKREKLESLSIGETHDNRETEPVDFRDEVLIKNTGASAPVEVEVEKPAEREKIKLNVIGKIDVDKLTSTRKPSRKKEEPSEQPVDTEKSEKSEKPEKAAQSGITEIAETAEVVEKVEKAEKPEKIEKAEATEKITKAEPVEQVEKTGKPEPKAAEKPVKHEAVEVQAEKEKETQSGATPPADEEDIAVESSSENAEAPVAEVEETVVKPEKKDLEVKVVGRIDLDSMNQRTRPVKKTREQLEKERKARSTAQRKEPEAKESRFKITTTPVETSGGKGGAPVIVQKKVIELINKDEDDASKKKKRKRISKDTHRISLDKTPKPATDSADADKKKKKKRKGYRFEVSEEDVDRQIKDTLARLTTKGKSKGSKYRKEKREIASQRLQQEFEKKEMEKNILRVTEFVTVNELANLMDVHVNEVIAACMSLGLFVSINQRLDAEALVLVAEEFNHKVEFITAESHDTVEEVEDDPEDLKPRPPIVTVMGHVDHGKTKLLDHIRNANVIAGEAGGITQHIGAYGVELKDGRRITFLDTPGHEAFTAMRARGAQITDVAIIVVAADDGIMPQTVEAINHAQAAGVPMVFAINKIDKPTANPEKIKEELANMNILVEDWGGKFQSQEISAKSGLNVDELLEKVLLEAEILNLKANPDRNASGTVIESSLDKGRGFVATILVQTGALKIGDILLAGHHFGRVKAMYNERGKKIEKALPSDPVLVLGLNGAPQAGDKFNATDSEKEAKEIATKREQLSREQGLRTQKHITLDEIGRRIAIGNFRELNVIVKGDVDGSIEALTDSLIKLSNEEIQVNIIHRAIGQISESDILLAAASNAIIIGFQVRPSMQARKLAEKEQIDIRLYSIIYDAINEIKSAMEGMLSPEIKEDIVATIEVLETFKITKVGTIAGCIVKEGKIRRDTKVRVIRDGIVIYTGKLESLKRFKDDVREVVSGQDCGLNIENFNDVKVGDIIEGYETTEIKKKL